MARALIGIASVLLLAVSLIACGNKQPDTPKSAEPAKVQPKAAAPQAAPPAPEVKVEKEVYVYDPKDRRDPFASLVEEKSPEKKAAKGAKPAESFDVEDIKLIAVVWDKQQAVAMVTLPDNKSFTVKKGMGLGLYGGKITAITRDSVTITEQVKDYRGQLKTKETILKLRKEED